MTEIIKKLFRESEYEEVNEEKYHHYLVASRGKSHWITIKDAKLTNITRLNKWRNGEIPEDEALFDFYDCQRITDTTMFCSENGEPLNMKVYFDQIGTLPVKNYDDMIILPEHAFLVDCVAIAMIGTVGVSKSTALTVWAHELSCLLGDYCLMEMDFSYLSSDEEEFESKQKNFHKYGLLPEHTSNMTASRPAYPFLCSNIKTGEKILMVLQDYAGEDAMSPCEFHLVANFRNLFCLVDAHQLIEGLEGTASDINCKIVRNLFNYLQNKDTTHVYVIITKADVLRTYAQSPECIEENRNLIENVLKNPSLTDHWPLEQTVHKNGFDQAAFNVHSDGCYELLRKADKAFAQKMRSELPPIKGHERLSFMAISSLGNEPVLESDTHDAGIHIGCSLYDFDKESSHGDYVIPKKDYLPWNIDLPIINTLKDIGMFPIKGESDPIDEEDDSRDIERDIETDRPIDFKPFVEEIKDVPGELFNRIKRHVHSETVKI